jgi:glycosyltransferase involved in cell wall biosynthesis
VKKYKPKHIHESIPNGVEIGEFSPAEKFPKKFVVGAVGNFSFEVYDDWKGFSKYIVPACKKARVELKWCGWQGKSSHGLVSKQLTMREMPDFYRSLSCLVSMSKSEGCSGVTMEAMASGLPVISTPVGWHYENCKDNILWVKRPKNETKPQVKKTIDLLAKSILYLKKNPEICVRMGQDARAFAEQCSWDVVIERWKKVFSLYLADKESDKAQR